VTIRHKDGIGPLGQDVIRADNWRRRATNKSGRKHLWNTVFEPMKCPGLVLTQNKSPSNPSPVYVPL